jgi:protocatechuate 3,4-dioxygenase beta subunit
MRFDSISEAAARRQRAFSARVCAIFAASLLLSSAIYGQVSAVLSGTVTDQSGAPVSGAKVTEMDIDTGLVRSTVTDAAGYYQFPSLPTCSPGRARAGKSGASLRFGWSAKRWHKQWFITSSYSS